MEEEETGKGKQRGKGREVGREEEMTHPLGVEVVPSSDGGESKKTYTHTLPPPPSPNLETTEKQLTDYV